MRKGIVSILLVVVMISALGTGCASSKKEVSQANVNKSSEEKKDDTEVKDGPIGISIPAADHGWIAGAIFYAQKKVTDLGLTEGAGYKIVTSENVNEQANDIDELISLGCTSIVLLPHNDEVSVAAQKIIDNGIKLIVFDRKVSGDYTAYVGGNNAGIGVKAAEYLGEALAGKGVIAVMSAPSVGSVSVERTDAFKEKMAAKYPEMTLVEVTASGFTQEAGLTMATDMLVSNSHIDAIFSIDDEPSLGILQAVKEAGRTEIQYISGGGGAQPWYNKIQTETDLTCFTETYSPSMIGDAIQVAMDIQEGKDYQKDTTIEPTTIDASNVDEFINEKSPY